VAPRERFDPFRGTSKEALARKFGVVGVNVFARKPQGELHVRSNA
jgi:hypothetical protein